MKKLTIHSKKAPEALGPYSQAVRTEGWLYLSGQVGIDPQTRALVPGGVEAQVCQIFRNIRAVLTEAGADLDNVVKATVFLKSMDDFKTVNAVYARHFQEPYPARSAVAVKELPAQADVEIEVVAVL